MAIFDITGDDIALLSDEQLRNLVGRLCEAELRTAGLSVMHVTYGGHQNAADGGIDVRVTLPGGQALGSIPRANAGYQVKKQDVPRAEIIDEMRPGGALRPAIQELAARGGAYIIVSSEGSTSDSALANRRAAMAEAVVDDPESGAILLDFYDRNRIATWVRSHKSVIPWVREAIGRRLDSWQSYGPWAAPITEQYLLDEKLRIRGTEMSAGDGATAREGIERIRSLLRQPRRVVRLVGLSGLGKTRLVQALFDERVGSDALNPDLAIYANLAEVLDPQPIKLATDSVAEGTPAILIVDNCPPELHNRLSEVCRQTDSRISLLTVEYDIRDDAPEGTDVYRIEPASSAIIEGLLRRRFPDVSDVDARRIAEFAGGNARMAIALASTVDRRGTLAGINEDQLFRRLFYQRHEPNEALYLSAQACSLVYSFDGEDVSDEGELARLAQTVGLTAQVLYRNVAELQRRELVQRRSGWRAILPQAVADRLAQTALQNVPYSVIDEHLLSNARLWQSFSRRLGYLHRSAEAAEIAEQWMAEGGALGDVSRLNDFGCTLFRNSAPAAPAAALATLERALDGADRDEARKALKRHLGLLQHLAYEAQTFDRVAKLMVVILTEEELDEWGSATRPFTNLFQARGSGTHATVEQRLTFVAELLESEHVHRRRLGVRALQAALEAEHFQVTFGFEFGAHSRDYGHWPQTPDEVRNWYQPVLAQVEKEMRAAGPAAHEIQQVLAKQFRGVWRTGSVSEELQRVCEVINEDGFWAEGWLAVKETLHSDAASMPAGRLERLLAIESSLRPTDLEGRIRAVVLAERAITDFDEYDPRNTDDLTAKRARAEALAQELGEAVSGDFGILDRVLPEVVTLRGPRPWRFGNGLGEGTAPPHAIWERLTDAMALVEQGQRQPQVLGGFLNSLYERDCALTAEILDESLFHDIHGLHYPSLQVSVPIQDRDIQRLKRSLSEGRIPARAYERLAYKRVSDQLPAPDLRDLILMIAAMPDGPKVATEILHMRLTSQTYRGQDTPPELIDAGCRLLEQLPLNARDAWDGYCVGTIAQACLPGDPGVAVAESLSRRLKEAIRGYEISTGDCEDLIDGLFRAQPVAALTGFCDGDQEDLIQGVQVLQELRDRRDVLSVVPEEVLLRWCDAQPTARYPAMARAILVARRERESEPWRWSGLAIRLLDLAPEPAAVLCELVEQLGYPRGASDRTTPLEEQAALLDQLRDYPALTDALTREKMRLASVITQRRQTETGRGWLPDEGFE